MTEHQRLLLVQARSCFTVFELLRTRPELPECHPLHYLQMATELLGKASAWRRGSRAGSHQAFAGFIKALATNRAAQKQLGYDGKNENWEHLIRKSLELAKVIESLAPALALDRPNPEYPWPRDAPQVAPAEHRFEVWRDLQETPPGRQFLKLIGDLFAAAHAYL